MSKKKGAELDAEILAGLHGTPTCTGMNPDVVLSVPLQEGKHRTAAEYERCYLASVIQKAGGSLSQAARIADMDRTNFRALLKKYGMHEPGASGKGLTPPTHHVARKAASSAYPWRVETLYRGDWQRSGDYKTKAAAIGAARKRHAEGGRPTSVVSSAGTVVWFSKG